jgi:hypothetical protein
LVAKLTSTEEFQLPILQQQKISVAIHAMTKIPLPYYGNKMMFSIASN